MDTYSLGLTLCGTQGNRLVALFQKNHAPALSDYDKAIRNWLANSAAARGSLPRETVDTLDQGLCPDCGHRGFVLGPRGGVEINIECGNAQCRARFNMARGITDHHLVWATRLAKEEDGGPSWQRPAST